MKKNLTAIAKELGVSASTVSKVINDRPGVSDELRSHINAYLDTIGFQPNPIAQSMISGHTNIIGLIVGDIRNPFYSELTYTLQHQLEEKGYMLMVYNSDYDTNKEVMFIKRSMQYKFAGLLLISSHGEQLLESIKEAQREGVAVVLINRYIEGFEGSFISLDNFQAGYMATKHLLDLGHRRIALMTGPMKSSASILRRKGFLQAMENLGLTTAADSILVGELTIESGKAMAKQLFSKKEGRPTAVVAGNDLIALGFMDYCAQSGIRVPEDISIVSFDNIEVASLNGINLTTIDQNLSLTGQKATDYILSDIENPGNTVIRRELIEPKLIIRNTTAHIGLSR